MPNTSKNTSLFLEPSVLHSFFGEGREKYLSSKDLYHFSLTSRYINNHATDELTKRAANVVLQHVVYGEQEQAEKMIKANPRLLLVKSQAVDYSSRKIIGTPFQGALGAIDERMWEMMKPYFEQLETQKVIDSAQKEMKKQFEVQFPDGIEIIASSQLQTDYNDLTTAIITNEDNGDAAIEKFREKITERKEIKSGKHFGVQHLIAAYKAYIGNFDTLATWDNREKYWQKVIGYVQRQMPANYAQAHCSGIQKVLDDAKQFKRTFDCDGYGKFFFPLDSGFGLGFDFGVFSYSAFFPGGTLCSREPAVLELHVEALLSSFVDYVIQNQNHLLVLNENLTYSPRSHLAL